MGSMRKQQTETMTQKIDVELLKGENKTDAVTPEDDSLSYYRH